MKFRSAVGIDLFSRIGSLPIALEIKAVPFSAAPVANAEKLQLKGLFLATLLLKRHLYLRACKSFKGWAAGDRSLNMLGDKQQPLN